jgi:hypothetical protein
LVSGLASDYRFGLTVASASGLFVDNRNMLAGAVTINAVKNAEANVYADHISPKGVQYKIVPRLKQYSLRAAKASSHRSFPRETYRLSDRREK